MLSAAPAVWVVVPGDANEPSDKVIGNAPTAPCPPVTWLIAEKSVRTGAALNTVADKAANAQTVDAISFMRVFFGVEFPFISTRSGIGEIWTLDSATFRDHLSMSSVTSTREVALEAWL